MLALPVLGGDWRPSCTPDELVTVLIPMAKYLVKEQLKGERLLAHSWRDPRCCLRNSGQLVTQLHSGRGEGRGKGRERGRKNAQCLLFPFAPPTFREDPPSWWTGSGTPTGGAPKSLNPAKVTVKTTIGDMHTPGELDPPTSFHSLVSDWVWLKCQGWPLNSLCSPGWSGICNPPVSTPEALGFQAYDTRHFLQ